MHQEVCNAETQVFLNPALYIPEHFGVKKLLINKSLVIRQTDRNTVSAAYGLNIRSLHMLVIMAVFHILHMSGQTETLPKTCIQSPQTIWQAAERSDDAMLEYQK